MKQGRTFLGLNGSLWFAGWLVYALILVTATHYPEVKLPDVPHSDKWIHTAAYFVLMTLWSGWGMTWDKPLRSLISGIVLLAVFGALDEITQPIFNRHADIWDWCCDVAGVLLSGGLYWLLLILIRKPAENQKLS